MTKKEILNKYNEYVEYSKNMRGNKDTEHWHGLKAFILRNHREIKDCTWYDLAGGYTSFNLDVGNTLSIGNELFDGYNNVVEYAVSLKAFNILEDEGFDLDLLPHTFSRIWGTK